jgi:UDPglucose--hexose-1-phosphate uridylyltransferase
MPELRKDAIVNRWVIIAQERTQRPHDFMDVPPQRVTGQACPFCEGNESETPNEILAHRHAGSRPDGPGWQVRVIPNKFPALVRDGDATQRGDDLCQLLPGVGAHEVIVESPRHLVSISELSETQLAEVLGVYRDRLVALKDNSRLAYALIFKNAGAAAGATIEHAHSQLIATPIVPANVQAELAGSLDYARRHGRCAYCDMIRQESTQARRLVLDTPSFVAFCPFAARFPFETWILPKNHADRFESLADGDLDELSGVLRRLIAKIEVALARPAYNYVIHTAPFDTRELGHYHWHIEVMPSVARAAGFEWGAGFFINPVPPEDAAEHLRRSP